MTILLYMFLILGYIYEDSDSLLVDNDSLTICGNHVYALKINIRNNSQLFVRNATGAPDSTGWLSLHAPLIVIGDSSIIDGSEKGYKGGYLNSHPWGYGPGGGNAGGVSGGAGGGGAYGGNGGSGGDLYGGAGGAAYGDPADTSIQMGSGGGAGRLSVVISSGGSGGASLLLHGNLADINSSSIQSNGQNGETGAGLEASGGGAGGGIMIWADTVLMSDVTIEAVGGNGGDAAFGGGGGGSGGRIKILFSSQLDTSAVTYTAEGGPGGIGDPGLPSSSAGDIGTIHIGIFTGITDLTNEMLNVIRVQPNPARCMVNITTEIIPVQIRMYDIAGRLIKSFRLLNHRETADLRGLERGVYFMIAENHELKPCKIVLIN